VATIVMAVTIAFQGGEDRLAEQHSVVLLEFSAAAGDTWSDLDSQLPNAS
jgi:hypothetical protein